MEIKYNDQGLVPAIIQDKDSKEVLMLGFMNQEAYQLTVQTKKATFFSRSKNRIWVKGETSGNFLNVISILNDCDNDSLLIQVKPDGPVCHKGTDSCWGNLPPNTLSYLESTIADRKNNPSDDSYVSSLFKGGINKVAQKVGEEAIEVVIEAKDDNDELFLDESADLLFHFLILLQAKGKKFQDVLTVLEERK